MRAGPTHLPISKVILNFVVFFLTLLVIKINFILEFSCFCTCCAENDPGTTQKATTFSCLEMYFGGNNHGFQEYSNNFALYTQADRLKGESGGSIPFSSCVHICFVSTSHL